MVIWIRSLRTGALAATLAAGAMVATSGLACADIACNSYSECWHTKQRYAVEVYPAELGIHFYSDDWRNSNEFNGHYNWMSDRDDDRGYYSRGRWHSFAN
jgi:hypothetical protein